MRTIIVSDDPKREGNNMETMRRIAAAYYERASEQEKEVAEEFFRKLDVNGDGIVTREELRKSLGSLLSSEKVFKQLDENGDGALDFKEVLAVYYMVHKTKIQVCCGCYDLLTGPYFSCFLCVGKTGGSFDLCCNCYHKGSIHHEHSADHFLDHHYLVEKLKASHGEAVKSPRKRQMEELLEIAKSHYLAASSEVQNKAYEFFRSMDTDGNEGVDLCEFLSFMRQEGYVQMRNSHFFDELDQDGNGILDFYEVMTLYYIIKSGRPFCDGCGDFIPGVYFSCVECYNHRSFDLCHKCYGNKTRVHTHDGRSQFLDNYTLLEAKRADSNSWSAVVLSRANSNSTETRSPVSLSNAIVPVTSYPNTVTYHHQPYYTYAQHIASSSSTAIVPSASNNHDKWEKWRVALQALEVAISLAGISGAALSCTVM